MFSVILNKLKTIINKKNSKDKVNRLIFLAGCVFASVAVLSVTIVPYIVNNFIKDAFISIFTIRNFSFIFWGLVLVCFLFSEKYSKEQIQWVLITFAYYVIFQVLAKALPV